MNTNKKFEYPLLLKRLEKLEKQTLGLIEKSAQGEVAEKLMADLQELKNRQNLRIAFVGEYSSGKSTIISALTGDKSIKIDANVATDDVAEYNWNDITLIATPGILAGKKEEHDQRTKEAFVNSDLIFYVLTNELFDDVLFNNFIDLAYGQHLEDKIFLILNKMGRESGEYDELVSNYSDSLRIFFEERGYDFSRFPIAYIDAQDYIDGIEDGDDEFVELSNFDKFIGLLNHFVALKGLIKKQLDSPVRLLLSSIENLEITQVDPAMAEFLNQFEKRLNASLREINRDADNLLGSFRSSCMNQVIALSHEIGTHDQDLMTSRANDLNTNINEKLKETTQSIGQLIEESYDRLVEEMQQFGSKEAIQIYADQIEQNLKSPEISLAERANFEKQKNILSWIKKGGSKLGDLTPGIDSIFSGISSASGSDMHNIVYNVGHFFGKKFKPWEAVRISSKIGKIAKFGIPVLTCAIEVCIAISDNREANKIMNELNAAKNKFITEYQSQINNAIDKLHSELDVVNNNYNLKRSELSEMREDLLTTISRNQSMMQEVDELKRECTDFIEIIERS